MKNLLTLGLISLTAVMASVGANADSKNTAAFLKAHVDKLEGKTVSVDTPFLRVLPAFSDSEEYVVFWVPTVDTDNRAPGGAIIAIADAEDKDKLISRYGLAPEREASRVVQTKRLRGVLRQVAIAPRGDEEAVAEEEAIQRGPVFIDLTDEGISGDEALAKFIRRHDGAGPRGPRRGPPAK
ncbi:MAG: hypothetical protein ACFBZ8_02520 [Opitutales bacterium]